MKIMFQERGEIRKKRKVSGGWVENGKDCYYESEKKNR